MTFSELRKHLIRTHELKECGNIREILNEQSKDIEIYKCTKPLAHFEECDYTLLVGMKSTVTYPLNFKD